MTDKMKWIHVTIRVVDVAVERMLLTCVKLDINNSKVELEELYYFPFRDLSFKLLDYKIETIFLYAVDAI